MVPQTTDLRCERTRRKQYAPPRRGIKTLRVSDLPYSGCFGVGHIRENIIARVDALVAVDVTLLIVVVFVAVQNQLASRACRRPNIIRMSSQVQK